MQAWEVFSPKKIQTFIFEKQSIMVLKATKNIITKAFAHKYMEELEDSFVGQNVQDIPRLWIDYGQPVDFVSE